ncbi:MAG TPA: hypothetical protein VG963_20250, partial [Polyangiaceae bacterium]|nr:hypothetical protein [Polyangiaceae bacterium]
RWLATPIAEGTLPTLGALLGVAGALDAEGAGDSRSENLHELAARFVNERLARASGKGSAEAQWLQRYGFDVLVKLAQEVLVADDQPWDVARSQDEWIARVPAEYQQSIDGAWIQWSLARAGERATARELERSLRELPPGAYRLVRALADARLLRPRGASGSLAIAPEFLKHAAVHRARHSLVYESSPFAWGEALLRPHAAPEVLATVYERSNGDDFAWIDALLELDLSSQPALVAAAEAAFVCLGLRVLCGAEPPSECVLGLWNEQLAWLAPGEELPAPRLLYYEGANERSALTDPAVFGLAALALSEWLGPGQGSPHALLKPADAAQPSPDLPRLFDAIYQVVRSPRLAEVDWAASAFALAGRLAQASPTLAALVGGHPLARPAQLVRALQTDEAHAIAIEDVGSTPIEVRALKLAGEQAGLAWEALVQGLWRAWQARPKSGAGDVLLGPDGACHALFWPHLPADVIDSACARWADQRCPLGCWGPSQWASFVSRFGWHFARQPRAALWLQAFEQMDRATLERAISDAVLWNADESEVRPLFAIGWRRAPEHLLALLLEQLGSGSTAAVLRLLQSAPSSADEALFTALGPALAPRTVQRPVLEVSQRWLAARVRARRTHWRQAYTLCAELEERIRRAMRARGI